MKRTTAVVLIALSLTLLAMPALAEIRIGMLAQRGPEMALKEWGALGDYLSQKLGDKVTIVPMNFTNFMDFCDTHPEGFIFTNPWFFVKAKVLKGGKAPATVKYQSSGNLFGGVIFTRRDSGIKTISDMRGKVVMCPKLSSPGGWLFQKGEIVKQGIVPEKDFKKLLETEKESHDEVVYAVKQGKVDVGTVRTNLLEAMQREGKINMDEFRILNEQHLEGFPEVCSTPLYPDWPVASLKNTPPQLAARMREALLSIPAGHPALEKARKIEKFVDAADYGPMESLCKFLGVAPFRSGVAGKPSAY
jgi:ABC-type phosphate/phosphonate transport system substrate-binding protein